MHYDILLAWNLKKSCKRKQSLLFLLCFKQLQLIRRSFSLIVGKVISLLCQRFPQTFFLIIVAKSIFLFCNNVFNILAIRNNFLLERLSANREIGFLKKCWNGELENNFIEASFDTKEVKGFAGSRLFWKNLRNILLHF